MTTKPLSSRRMGANSSPGCLLLFFSIFLVAGSVAFYFTTVRPLREYLASRSWLETTCTVLQSSVGTHSDSDGSTYSVDIVYIYDFQGRRYQADRYGFLGGSSSGYEGKADIVARYPPNSKVPCWIDPAHPEKAVLNREPSWQWLIGLVPLLFVGVGGGGLVWGLRVRRQEKALAAAGPALGQPSAFGSEAPRELKPDMSPGGKFLGLVLISLFWNGIVSVFVVQAVKVWRAGQPDGCMTVFLIPFVLIGLLLIFGGVHQFLVLFNPRLRLTLNPGSLRLGDTAYLQWTFAGRASRVRRLSIVLEGREEAQYRRGTTTHTDRSTFATLTVIDTAEPFTIANGSASFGVPADLVPSFKADHNKIVWSLKAKCDIPGWPDSDDEYEVQVAPGRVF